MHSLVFQQEVWNSQHKKTRAILAISAGVHSNNKKLPLLHARDRGDHYSTWSLYQSIRPQRRNKVERGFFSSSLVHFKQSQDWVISGKQYTNRVCSSNSYRPSISMCGNWLQLLHLMKSLSCHRTAHQLINFWWVLNLATWYDWWVFWGGRKVKA